MKSNNTNSALAQSSCTASSQDLAVFNAIVKIYIDSNNNREQFLKETNVRSILFDHS